MTTNRTAHTVRANGIRLHVVEEGEGPLVLLVHGFPESWYSWRHQLTPLAEAGYRAAAIDVRGYGRSSKPTAIEAYRMVCHVADNVELVAALGAESAVIVGHDWGSPIAASSALLRPDLFTAVALLSVPYAPRSLRRPLEVFRAMFGGDELFYMDYFQEPGVAEAEIEEDLASWLRGFYVSSSGDAPPRPDGKTMLTVDRGGTLRDRLSIPEELPAWLTEEDLAFYVAELERTGFAGPLNRYRNLDRDWEDLAAFTHRPLTVPALYIGGERDGPTIWGQRQIERHAETLPRLHGSHILAGSGHWLQQERPREVTELLLDFLAAVAPR
jgi:pimeloyl-ACP methyl ester carboxylesterase